MTDGSIKAKSYVGPSAASTDPRTVLVVGAGRAGSALGLELARSRLCLVGLWDLERRPLPASLAPLFSSGGHAPPQALMDRADVVLLAVPDRAIAVAAQELRPRAGASVLHLSGALGPEVLGALPEGVHGGCYHPLQSFRSAGSPTLPVPPYAVAVDGDDVALRAAFAIAAATDHLAVRVPAEGRAAYHAAAVLASNCLVALQAVAGRAMGLSGVPPELRWPLLWPLLAGTVGNLADGEFGAALTGPVVRGDEATVADNLEALRPDPVAAGLYRALGLATVDLAEGLHLDAETAARVRRLLEEKE